MSPVARLGSVLVLEAEASALPFIVDSWCKSFERPALLALGLPSGEDLPRGMRRVVCKATHDKVHRILARPECRALVLAHESSPKTLLGHCVYEAGRLHYAYLLESVRRMGLARLLVQASNVRGTCYTFHTHAGAKLARDFTLTYTPEEA